MANAKATLHQRAVRELKESLARRSRQTGCPPRMDRSCRC